MENSLQEYKQKWFDFMDYKPHYGQKKLHFPDKSTARFFVMVCGRRFGKTTASAMEATFYASQPNKRIWLVGLSYDKADLIKPGKWHWIKISEMDHWSIIGHLGNYSRISRAEKYFFEHIERIINLP